MILNSLKRNLSLALRYFLPVCAATGLWASAPAPRPRPFGDTLVVALGPSGAPLTAANAGQSFTLEICANSCTSPDAGNSSALTLATSDAGATLPAGAQLTNGVYQGPATLVAGGSQTISASDASDASGSASITVAPVAGTVKATTPVSFSVTLNLGSAIAPAAVAVVTQGAANLDFTDADAGSSSPAAGTCDADQSAGTAVTSCTVNVNFTAQAPGARPGAVVVYDSSNNVLATAYLAGLGQGSLLAVSNNALTTGLLSVPEAGSVGGVIVDAAGDIFTTDVDDSVHYGYIYELPKTPSGYGTQITLPTPAGFVWDSSVIALDGAGDLLVYQGFSSSGYGFSTPPLGLYRIPRNPDGSFGNPVSLGDAALADGANSLSIYSLAVDAAGNIYAGGAGTSNAVVEMAPSGGSPVVIADTAFAGPKAMVFDAAGDLFLQDGGTIYELAAGTWSSTQKATPVLIVNGFLSTLDALAIDNAGDVYFVDNGAGSVDLKGFMVPAGATNQTETSLSPLFDTSTSLPDAGNPPYLAMDAAGNLYVQFGSVTKIDRQDMPGADFGTVSVGASAAGPLSVSLASIGTTAANISAISAVEGGGASDANFLISLDSCGGGALPPGSGCGFTVGYSPTVAGTDDATLTLASDAFDSPLTSTAALTGTAQPLATQFQVAISAASVGAPVTATITAQDAAGDTITRYAGTVNFTSSSVAVTLPANATLTNGVGSFPVTFNDAGTFTLSVTDTVNPSLTGTASVVVITPASNGPLAGGATAQSVTLTLANGGTPASIAVLTQGATGLDFTLDASPGTCTAGTTYTAGDTCTVQYDFNPKAPGLRSGAVVLYDASSPGVPLATAYISGIGTGSQLAFNGAAPTTLGFTGLTTAVGVAVDAGGDVFELDQTNGSAGAVNELLPNGTVVTVYSGFGNATGIALDGAGNLYVADNGDITTSILRRQSDGTFAAPAAIGSSWTFNSVAGIYLDGAGNLFVADPSAQKVVEVPANGGAAYEVIGQDSNSIVSDPTLITGNAGGDLIVVDSPSVYVVHSGAWTPTSTASSADYLANISNGLQYVKGVAVDPAGDTLILDEDVDQFGNYSGRLVSAEVGYVSATLGTLTPIETGLSNNALNLAIDAGGNLYVADNDEELTNTPRVLKFDRADVPSLNFGTFTLGLSPSREFLAQSIGNADVQNMAPTLIGTGFGLSTANTCRAYASTLTRGGGCILGVTFAPTTTGPAVGALTFSSDAFNASSMLPGGLSGTAITAPTATQFVLAATPTAVSAGGATTITITAEDNSGDLASDYQGTVAITTSDPNAGPLAVPTFSGGVATVSVTLASVGVQTITATDTSAPSLTGTVVLVVNPLPIAGNVGGAAAPQTITFNFVASTPVAAIGVLTQGVSGLDFTRDATTPGSCAAQTYTAGQSCSIVVDFAAKAPGVRTGAVVLYDAGNNPLQTFYLSGTATGSLLAFTNNNNNYNNNNPFRLSGGSGVEPEVPYGVAVDAAGNVFEADQGFNGVLEIPHGGGANVQITSSLPKSPTNLALDGAGNLYIADTTSVLRMSRLQDGTYAAPVAIGTDFSWQETVGIYVDAKANVFVTDDEANVVEEIPADGSASFTVTSDSDNPSGITGDAAGNLYFSDENTAQISQIPAGSWSPASPATDWVDMADSSNGLQYILALTVTPHGDLLVADGLANAILIVPQGETSATAGTLATVQSVSLYLRQMALDAAGNIYAASPNYGLFEFDQADVPGLTFSAIIGTPANQSFVITSIGSADAQNVAAATAGSSTFTLDPASTCPATLAAGTSCILQADFTPTTGGVTTGTLSVASDEFDAATIQAGALDGFATTGPETKLVFSPAPPATAMVNTDLPIFVQVTDADGNPFPVSDRIQLVIDGGSMPQILQNVGANGTASFIVPAADLTAPGTLTLTAQDPYSSISLTDANATVTLVQSQTISFSLPSTAIYGAALPLAATGGASGNAVTYAVTGPGTITGSSLTVTGVGSIIVTASQLGNTNYADATPVVQTVTATAAPLTVTANSATMVAGAALPTFTGTVTGTVNSDSFAETFATTASSSSPAGTYSITPSVTGANLADYAVTATPGTLTITLATQAIIFNPPTTAVYGSTLPLIATGGASGNTVTYGVTGPATITGSSLLVTGLGAITVTANQAGNATYAAATPVVRTITADQAPLTITANSATMVAGAALPTFTGTVTGTVTGDSFAETFATTATSSSPAGTYPITPSVTGANLADYAVTATPGTLTITLATQAITFNPPSTAVYGSTLPLIATGGASGNAVTYGVTGPATITGSSLLVTGVGAITVTANQAGNSTYAAATPVVRTITADQAPLTITADSATMVAAAALPTFTGTVTGAVTGDSFAETFATTATSSSPAGTYPITPSVTGANLADYAVTATPGTLTITLAPQAITFNPPSTAVYGSTLPLIATGGASGNAVTYGVTGPATITGSSLLVTGVGAVTVTASQAGNASYAAATPVVRTITAGQAPLTITANSATMVAGAALPTFTGTVTGTVNGDSFAETFATTATSSSPAGTYPITPSVTGANLADYAVTATPGTLTITLAPQAITFNPPSTAVYGSTLPLIATGGASGNAVTYGVTGPATITGSSLLVTGVGAITVTANQAGNSTYAAATPVVRTITAGQAPLTVSSDSFTIKVGAALPTFTGTVVGAVNGDSFAETFATTATASSPVGTYPITPSVTGANLADYTVTANPGTLTITDLTPQVITFSLPSTAVYGASALALGATGGASGNPVSYSVTGPGAISGGALAITGAGTITVTASQAGNASYAAASPVARTVVVATAPLTITANNAAIQAGAALPTFTGTVTGAVNGDSFAETFSTTATSSSPAGTYPIVPSVTGANLANYTVTATNGTLTIAALTPQVITFSLPSTAVYGASALALVATGGASGNPVSYSVTGPGAISGGALAITGAGTITVTASQAGNASYAAASPVARTVVVATAPLTITANNAAIQAGAALPTFTGTVTGAVNGDSFAETFSTTATSSSPAGTYPIVPSVTGANLADYTVTATNGTLTIAALTPQVITFSLPSTAVYGASALALVATGGASGNPVSYSVTGPGAISGGALAITGAGTITVTASQAGNASYAAASPVARTVVVATAPLTITANNAAIQAGAALPTFTGTVTGAVNGDSFAETFSTTATSSSPAGTYPIVPSVTGANLADYTVTVTNGTLTITAAAPIAPTVSLSAATLNFGSQVVGTPSAAQTLVLTAGGATSLVVGSVSASGDFAATSNCATVASGASCSINVVFTPTAAGNRSGTLTIADNAANSPQTVALTGNAVVSGASLQPGTLNFGSVVVGANAVPQSVTLQNTGGIDLHVSVIVATGDFSASGNCSVIPAGGACSIAVAFAPTASGARSGTLTITDDAPSGTQTATLQGTGTAPGVALSSANITFSPVVVGAISPVQTVILTASGTAPLTGIGVAAQGDFRQSNNCPATLAATATCTIQITFAPTLAGAESGSVEINDNLGSQPVAVSGTGLAPGVNLSAADLDFGGVLVGASSPAQTVTLTNSGTASLAITAVAAPTGFIQTSNCIGTLAAGGSCGINLSFAPSAAGPFSGTVAITDAAGTQTIAVSGQGTAPGLALTPSVVLFGAQVVGGGSQAQTLTVTNTGTAAVSLKPITASGDFAIVSQCSATAALAPGASCLVSVTFNPAAAGSRTGTVAASSSDGVLAGLSALSGNGIAPGLDAAPSEVFFGSQTVEKPSSAQTVTVTNSGTAPLSVGPITVSGDFAEADTCSTPLNPAQTCVVSVTMTPTTAGTRTGTLTIFNTANGSYPVALSGVGEAAGVSLSPTQLAFGSQPIPGANSNLAGAAQTVTLTNTGNAPLAIASIAPSGDFTETNNCGAALPVQGSCTISVAFVPTGLGQRTGSLSINDNVAGGATQTVTLQGFGSPNGLVMSPATLNFGGAAVNVASAPQTATLTNGTGQAIQNLVITTSGEFSQTDDCNGGLANGATCTLNVTLLPLTTGAVTGSIGFSGQLAGGAADRRLPASFIPAAATTASSGLAVISVSGGGTPATLALAPATLQFTSEPVGKASAGQTVTITNSGSAALTGLSVASSPDFPFTTTCGTSLAGGGAACTIAVVFQPTAAGNRTGALTVTADGGLQTQVPLAGTALGGTLQATPSSLTFAPAPLGVASAAQTITLTAVGAPIALQSLAFSNSAFTLAASTCGALPANLAAAASCTISVVYAPRLVGTQSATLTVGSNASNSAVDIGLTGSGNSAGLTLAPLAVAFPTQGVGRASAGQTVTVSNSSGATVAISGISVTGANAGDFTSTSTCGSSLAAGASCTLSVVFQPGAAGARAAVLNLNDAAGDQTIALSGSGSDFTLTTGPAAGVTAGQTAIVPISLTSIAGDNQSVALSCTVNGSGTSCVANPTTITIGGTAATAATLQITTTAPQFAALPPTGGFSSGRLGELLALLGLLALAIWFLRADAEERKRRWKLALIGGAMALSTACGGVSNLADIPGTGAATLTVQVTATSSNGVVHTATAEITVAALR